LQVLVGEPTDTQTRDNWPAAKLLTSLASKAGDFWRYSPALENVGRSESNLLLMNAIAIPSFLLHTAQMLGFSSRGDQSEKIVIKEGGRGKGTE
jgi:hypothetical protein